MKDSKLFILALLILTIIFSNAAFVTTVNAAAQTNVVKVKVAGYIYNGALKLKNDKYGIEITEKAGTKNYVVFDAKGQKLTKELISKNKLKAGSGITVNGIIKKNVLQVISIAEKAQKPAKEQTFNGWLGDSDCSPDLDDPSAMSTMCLKCQHCEASGYGISVKQVDGKYIYYKFDANGHRLAKENIVDKATEKKVPEIVVTGSLEGDIIKVTSISVK
jgi:hypothetical protein